MGKRKLRGKNAPFTQLSRVGRLLDPASHQRTPPWSTPLLSGPLKSGPGTRGFAAQMPLLDSNLAVLAQLFSLLPPGSQAHCPVCPRGSPESCILTGWVWSSPRLRDLYS